jgi:hypothetical protein
LSGEANPYRAPDAEIVAPYAGPRFRVRIIPGFICYYVGISGAFGLFLFLFDIGKTVYRNLTASSDSIVTSDSLLRPRVFLVLILWIGLTLVPLFAARAWMAGAWRKAALMTIIGAIITVLVCRDPFP